ncbi:hypothetical protein BFP77_07345 [Maribacter sp. 4U21]|nr:hypothetical protein BFP77_07345 [Maribacter sp. 4U21]
MKGLICLLKITRGSSEMLSTIYDNNFFRAFHRKKHTFYRENKFRQYFRILEKEPYNYPSLMQVSLSRFPIIFVLVILFSSLCISCSKNYDLVSDYVVLEESKVSLDSTLQAKDDVALKETESKTDNTATLTTP